MDENPVSQAVTKFCEQLPANSEWVIGLSGGVDSVVLTYAIYQYILKQKTTPTIKFSTFHVNHGLQLQADEWQDFANKLSQSLNFPFQAVSISMDSKNRQGLESVARDKRYQALFSACKRGGGVITANHRQDQLETILLNLFRGTGIKGLLGMPVKKMVLNKSISHVRPLLNVALADILAYAKQHKLTWVEDPSNENLDFKRNYVRHKVLPVINMFSTAVENNIANMASNLADEFSLLNELAEQDLAICEYSVLSLDLAKVAGLSWARQKNIIRFWLDEKALFKVKLTKDIFKWLQASLALTNPNSHPSKLGKNFEIKVEKQRLYFLPPPPPKYSVKLAEFNAYNLGFDEQIIVESVAQQQASTNTLVRNINTEELDNKDLKKWFKQNKIVFWNRSRWPVIVKGDNSIEVVGFKKQFKV